MDLITNRRFLSYRVGEIFKTNEGCSLIIVEYHGSDNCDIKFLDSVGHIMKHVAYSSIKSGKIKNPYHKSIYGVGYFGVGEYSSCVNNKPTKAYTTWASMLSRCYSEKSYAKSPSYTGCSVVECWHNFQNFAKWHLENYTEGLQLDKDILVKGNKIYSPETCCFVPHKINSLFTKCDKVRGNLPVGVRKNGNKFQVIIRLGDNIRKVLGNFPTIEEAFSIYKEAKENYIKEIAEEFKNILNIRAYQALINYKVEITD